MTTTTDTTSVDAGHADRIAALRAKRAGVPTTGRRHPARASRIAAAGISVSTMFGLVAVMGMAKADGGAAEAAAPVPAPSVVVVHHLPAASDATAAVTTATSAPATVVAATNATTSVVAPPVALTAPRVTVAPVAAAAPTPAATHGSR